MGEFSIWHILILLFAGLLPGMVVAFLPLFIKPRGPNRFGPPTLPQAFPSGFVLCLKKYADFNGRARRSEFWWYYLGVILILVAAALVSQGTTTVTDLVTLAFLLPWLAAATRRLHDLNRSGWWILLGFTGFGLISLIVLLAWPARKEDAAF